MGTLVNAEALAQRLGITISTLYRWMKTRQFPAPIKLSPGTVRWDLGAVEDWVRERESAGAPACPSGPAAPAAD